MNILPCGEFLNFIILNMARLPSLSSVNYDFSLKVSTINYFRNILGGFLVFLNFFLEKLVITFKVSPSHCHQTQNQGPHFDLNPVECQTSRTRSLVQ